MPPLHHGVTRARVDVELKATEPDGAVRAEDFLDFLRGMIDTMVAREREEAGRAYGVYRIVRLAISSAAVGVEVETPTDAAITASSIVREIAEGVALYATSREFPASYGTDSRKALSSALRPLQRHVSSATLVTDDREVRITAADVERPPMAAPVAEMQIGSYSGFLDAVNVHRTPVFYLYPVAGPSSVRCVFDTSLLPKVSGALRSYVTVRGLLEYESGIPFPHRITVEDVKIHPALDEAPTLASLAGVAPNLTGGMGSVEFVRAQRDA